MMYIMQIEIQVIDSFMLVGNNVKKLKNQNIKSRITFQANNLRIILKINSYSIQLVLHLISTLLEKYIVYEDNTLHPS